MQTSTSYENWVQHLKFSSRASPCCLLFIMALDEFHPRQTWFIPPLINVQDSDGTNQSDIMSRIKMFPVNQSLLSEPVCRFLYGIMGSNLADVWKKAQKPRDGPLFLRVSLKSGAPAFKGRGIIICARILEKFINKSGYGTSIRNCIAANLF